MLLRQFWIYIFTCWILVVPLFGQDSTKQVVSNRDSSPCQLMPKYKAFDFWVGEWEVVDSLGKKLGTNVITKKLNDCLIYEIWTSANGNYSGQSVNYYDPSIGKWRQNWVDAFGGVVHYEGEIKDGVMHFQGENILWNGTKKLARVVLRPIDDVRVHQLIEHSNDEGETWQVIFGGTYIPKDEKKMSERAKAKDWQVFELNKLVEERAKQQRPYLRFLDESSMSLGLYVLQHGAEDRQSPHDQDEVYYIDSGKAILRVGKDEIVVRPGSIVYVKAKVPHKFEKITEDVQVLVIFPKKPFDESAPDWLAFELAEIQTKRKSDENIWHKFLDVPTMRFGLYMLPKKLGGDNTLTHEIDEVNIVVNGSAKFKVGEGEIDVQPGSIVFVKAGVGHYFHSLSEDFDVLILFQKK